TSKVDNPALLLMVCCTYLLTLPVSIWFLHQYGYRHSLISLKARIFMISLTLISAPMALDLILMQNQSKYARFVDFLTTHGDWLGAALIAYMYLWICAFLVSAATTKGNYYVK